MTKETKIDLMQEVENEIQENYRVKVKRMLLTLIKEKQRREKYIRVRQQQIAEVERVRMGLVDAFNEGKLTDDMLCSAEIEINQFLKC